MSARIRLAPLRARFATSLLFMALAAAPAGIVGAAAAPPASKPVRLPTSTQASPGWTPAPADPESLSVVYGRRLNAPLTKAEFHGGAKSLDELGRIVCRLLHHSDRDSLFACCLRDHEFRDVLWPEFPESRPATGLEWTDAWTHLELRLRSGTSDAVGEFGGRVWQFVRFERTDTTAAFRNFALHDGLVLVVKNDRGEIEKWNWLRSVAERKGRFKIHSVRD